MTHVFESPYAPIEIPEISITDYVFRGLKQAEDRPIYTEVNSGREISGTQAMEQIRAVAGGLLKMGLEKGQMVAIMAPNSIDYFVVLHAVAYAGGTVTLVNPSYTASELAYQLRETRAHLLFVDSSLLDIANDARAGTEVSEVFTIGGASLDARAMSSLLGTPLESQVPVDLAEDLAAVPFSSGTTGLPKGVMLTHQNLVANATIWQSVRNIGPEDVTPTFLPFFHIFGLTLMQLVYPGIGAHVHLMHRFDLEQFLQLTQDTKAQRLWVVPPIALALAKHPVIDSYDLSAVREVGSGAAPLSTEIGKLVGARLGCAFYQGYGMTEIGGVGTAHTQKSSMSDTLGAVIANATCRIVDPETMEDRGVGEEGELWMKGAMVMKGYLNSPEATAETITPDGWLRTGDIGSFDEDGLLRIHDRLKEMIKVKGFQVAPAEVEAALVTHPGIADAAVFGVVDEEAGEVPMGVVAFAAGNTLSLQEVQTHLRGQLAKYKVIQRMEVVETVPKSASGKILRRILREQYT